MSDLLPLLYKLVSTEPGLTGGQYTARLRAVVPQITRKQVNRCLYSNSVFHTPAARQAPSWRVTGKLPSRKSWVPNQLPTQRVIHPKPPSRHPPLTAAIIIDETVTKGLNAWQSEAFSKWINNGRCGIVEAVTGAGKSRLAIAAIRDTLNARGRSVVVVPSVALLEQWAELLRAETPTVSFGMLGNQHRVTSDRVTLAVVHSLTRRVESFQNVDLLVADEVHGYGAATFSKALLPSATSRLGLTATLERTDDAVEEVLLPYFGKVIYQCDFQQARKDGRLAQARIALLGVRLEEEEREAFDNAVEEKRNSKRKLVNHHGVVSEPIGEFLAAVQNLASQDAGEATRVAYRYLAARSEEAQILANARAKRRAVIQCASLFGGQHRGLIFCERIAAAEEVADLLATHGVRAKALTSSVPRPQRHILLEQLRGGELDALTTATALDQGIDVPDVDTAIIVASNQQKRQMIQRLGRVLRMKSDSRVARAIITYALDTWEDPAVGQGRQEFVKIARQAAEHLHNFGGNWDAGDVCAFLTSAALTPP